jgi:nucleoid-associated protein YgaU
MKQVKNNFSVSALVSALALLMIVSGVFLIIIGIKDSLTIKSPNPQATDNISVADLGEISVGISTTKTPQQNNTEKPENKQINTQEAVSTITKWHATDYHSGDIVTGQYTVKPGDTLWEISEAVYGSGFKWKSILAANKDKVGFLPNGSQALIYPGQVLNIPKV